MEFTPQRPRRIRADPPSGAVFTKSKSRHRASPYADNDKTACTKVSTKFSDVEKHFTASCRAASLALDEANVLSQWTSNNVDEAKADNDKRYTDNVRHGETAWDVDQDTQETVPMFITNVDHDGHVEFGYKGAVYRVFDAAAFENAMVRAQKPAKQSLSALRRAQRMARKTRTVSSEHPAESATNIAIDAKLVCGSTSTLQDNALSAAVRAAGGICADIPRGGHLAKNFAFTGPTVADELRGDTSGCM